MLLSEISQFTKWVDTKFIYDSWKKYSREDVVCSPSIDGLSPSHTPCTSPLVAIMEVVGNQAGHMSKVAVDDIKSEFVSFLSEYSTFITSPGKKTSNRQIDFWGWNAISRSGLRQNFSI